MQFYPTQLSLTSPDRLRIAWNDGQIREYSLRELRDACPCATCREKRQAPPTPPNVLPVLSAAELQPLRLSGAEPQGNYAYAFHFSDGHDTGIYTLELLRELGREVSVGGQSG
jgi:DUF971 family protein